MSIKTKGVKFQKFVEDSWQRLKVRYRLYNETRIIRSMITGGRTLSKEQKQEIQKLFSPYFKVDYTAHTFYYEKTGEFHANYIPDGIWYAYIDPFFNNRKLDTYIDNKCFYPRIFPGVRMPEIYCYRLNGFWYADDYNIISAEEVEKKLHDKECFLKMASSLSGCGFGVTWYNPAVHTPDRLHETLSKEGDMVVQTPIKQHSVIAALNSSSVNTIRSLSLLRKDGSVKIYSTVLRMGRQGSKVDNASSGGVTCGIRNDGSLTQYGHTRQGEPIDAHPDSHVKFQGITIPNFDAVLQMVKKMHPMVPDFRMVSWDIALNEECEPVLIEMNPAYGELDFHQLNNGPIFGEDTTEILDEVFGKKKQ